MKFLNTEAGKIAVGVLALGVVVMFFSRRASAAVSETVDGAVELVNPTSSGNFVNRAVTAVGDSIDDGDSGNDSFSLGSLAFDLFNPRWRNYDPNAPTDPYLQPFDKSRIPDRRPISPKLVDTPDGDSFESFREDFR